jgi:hypothetical protein
VVFTELNIDDVNRLSQLRIERLAKFFAASLSYCSMYVNANNKLIIACFNPDVMGELLDDSDELCYYACLILGVRSLSIHLSAEEFPKLE